MDEKTNKKEILQEREKKRSDKEEERRKWEMNKRKNKDIQY